MTNDELENQRLTNLLRAVQAEPDDAALRLAMARLAAADLPPRWLAWALRPVALGAAAALLICTATVSFWWLRAGVETTSLSDQVMAAAGASSAPDLDARDNAAPAGASTDSGTIQ